MSRIKLLPDNLINRIAAGEVVERPASVLKELLDNSLDSGADRILVEFLAGGRKMIRVSDNGCGMAEDDLLLSVERHATSKISAPDDLDRITTLGFRGEALASIGAVCRLTITTATAAGEGLALKLFAGRLTDLGPAARNQGTTVEAADLFYNLPARRKFLKTEATESAHLLETVQRYALSRPGLSLVCRQGAKELFAVTAQQDLAARCRKALGRSPQELIFFEAEEQDLKTRGYLGQPRFAGRSSAGLYLFVSGRPVRDRLLSRAVSQGYGRLLPAGRWPAAVIFLELPPSEVDVNVHPAKTEVRFREPDQIFNLVSRAVERAVSGQAFEGTPHLLNAPPPGYPASRRPGPEPPPPAVIKDSQPQPPWLETPPAPGSAEWDPAGGGWGLNGPPPSEFSASADGSGGPPPALRDEPRLETGRLKPIGQFQNSYILAQSSEKLFIIDQHAAHERILFNRLKKETLAKDLASQNLLAPETFELPAPQAYLAAELSGALKGLGFELSPFGGQTVILKAIPAILAGHDPWPALLEILSAAQGRWKNLDGAGLAAVGSPILDNWLFSLACRAALKAGQRLSVPEMERLLDDLAQAQNGGYCPHGRPAVFCLSLSELNRKFGR